MIVTVRECGAQLRVSEAAINVWIRQGMPTAGTRSNRRGRPSTLVETTVVSRWKTRARAREPVNEGGRCVRCGDEAAGAWCDLCRPIARRPMAAGYSIVQIGRMGEAGLGGDVEEDPLLGYRKASLEEQLGVVAPRRLQIDQREVAEVDARGGAQEVL